MTCTGLSRTVTALNDEWSTLADEPAPLSWRAVPALPLGTLGDVLAGVRSAPDTVLLALLGLQAEGDALAGRVVVQAMLPKMILMAVRDDWRSELIIRCIDDYLAGQRHSLELIRPSL